MKQFMQFTVGLLVGLFVWRFYDLIHMAISDGLAQVGITDPYVQAAVVLAAIGFVIFAFVHGGTRKLAKALSE